MSFPQLTEGVYPPGYVHPQLEDHEPPKVCPPGTVEIVKTPKVIQLQYVHISVDQVELNVGAKCFVTTFDENRDPVDRHHIMITGDDYNRWIEDDDIIQLVLEKLGMERASAPTAAV
jgi:hypothetical protein